MALLCAPPTHIPHYSPTVACRDSPTCVTLTNYSKIYLLVSVVGTPACCSVKFSIYLLPVTARVFYPLLGLVYWIIKMDIRTIQAIVVFAIRLKRKKEERKEFSTCVTLHKKSTERRCCRKVGVDGKHLPLRSQFVYEQFLLVSGLEPSTSRSE